MPIYDRYLRDEAMNLGAQALRARCAMPSSYLLRPGTVEEVVVKEQYSARAFRAAVRAGRLQHLDYDEYEASAL